MAFVLDKSIDSLGTGFVVHLSADELAAMGLRAGDDIEVRIEKKGDFAWERIPTASPEELQGLEIHKSW